MFPLKSLLSFDVSICRPLSILSILQSFKEDVWWLAGLVLCQNVCETNWDHSLTDCSNISYTWLTSGLWCRWSCFFRCLFFFVCTCILVCSLQSYMPLTGHTWVLQGYLITFNENTYNPSFSFIIFTRNFIILNN